MIVPGCARFEITIASGLVVRLYVVWVAEASSAVGVDVWTGVAAQDGSSSAVDGSEVWDDRARSSAVGVSRLCMCQRFLMKICVQLSTYLFKSRGFRLRADVSSLWRFLAFLLRLGDATLLRCCFDGKPNKSRVSLTLLRCLSFLRGMKVRNRRDCNLDGRAH